LHLPFPYDKRLKRNASYDIRLAMRAVAERLTLPFKLGLRRSNGCVPGAGTGSSHDFQDHRPYVPGDDPRHIDWQAYARSGNYTMKLYREEVHPLADLVLDASPSMFLDDEKGRRTLEISWFCAESAHRSGASVRLFSIEGPDVTLHKAQTGWEFSDEARSRGRLSAPDLRCIPWRAASLRVFISDLLYPGEPGSMMSLLLANRGRSILLVPYSDSEADPDWLGNTQLIDCESEGQRNLRFDSGDLRAYSATYLAHFNLWRLEARRHGIPFARVAASRPFTQALSEEGIPAAAVELV
jgi:uncharacterized protein (DUF58 family)